MSIQTVYHNDNTCYEGILTKLNVKKIDLFYFWASRHRWGILLLLPRIYMKKIILFTIGVLVGLLLGGLFYYQKFMDYHSYNLYMYNVCMVKIGGAER